MQPCFYYILAASNSTKTSGLYLWNAALSSLWRAGWMTHSVPFLRRWVPVTASPPVVLSQMYWVFILDSTLSISRLHPEFWHEPDPPASSSLQMPSAFGGHRHQCQRRATECDSLQRHSDSSLQHRSIGHSLHFQGGVWQCLLLHPVCHGLLLFPGHNVVQVHRRRRGRKGPLRRVHKRRAAVSAKIQHRPHGEVLLWRGEQPLSHRPAKEKEGGYESKHGGVGRGAVNRARKTSVLRTSERPACDFANPVVSSFFFSPSPPSTWQSEVSRERRLPLMIRDEGGNVQKCGSVAGRNLLLWGSIRISNTPAFNEHTPHRDPRIPRQAAAGQHGHRVDECVCVWQRERERERGIDKVRERTHF